MKISELVKHITEDMLDDRAELVSGESDELFSADRVLRYLGEAERRFCRDAWVLEDRDATLATVIGLVEDKTDYPLHKSVLFVKSARLSDSDIDLVRVGYNDNRLWGYTWATDPYFWDQNIATTETAGRPGRFSTDMGTRILRVRAKPDATAAALKLNLVVVRMPLKPIVKEDTDREFEIPEEFHMDLALYAAGMCLTKTADIDADLRALGRQWLGEFDAAVTRAKRDRQRFQQSAPRFRFGGWVN